MKMRKDRIQKCRPYLVYLNKSIQGVKFHELKKVEILSYTKITWEDYKKPTKAKQCYNCQEFGHGERNCFKSTKCVKCGEGRKSRSCEKFSGTNNKCDNCEGNHTANYSTFSKYQERLNRIILLGSKRIMTKNITIEGCH